MGQDDFTQVNHYWAVDHTKDSRDSTPAHLDRERLAQTDDVTDIIERSQYQTCTKPRPSGAHSPIVGMVVTISPSLSLYRMVVFPAASRPTETTNSHQVPNSFRSTPTGAETRLPLA